MIKGWRNDPRWVEFYKKRDQERAGRQAAIMKSVLEMKAAVDEATRTMEMARMELERPRGKVRWL